MTRKFTIYLFLAAVLLLLVGSTHLSAQQFADSVKWRIYLTAYDSSIPGYPAFAKFGYHPDANYGPPNDTLAGFTDRWFENSTPSDTELDWPPTPPGTFLDFRNVRPPYTNSYQVTMLHPFTDSTLIDTLKLEWNSDGLTDESPASQLLSWPSPTVLKYYADSIILSYSISGTTFLHADLTKDSMYLYNIHKDTISDGTPIPANNLRLTVYHPKPAPLPPDVVNAVRPANGTVGFPSADTLAWSLVPTFDGLPVYYRVQLATSRTFSPSSIILQDSISGTWRAYSGLTNSIWYYWRVKAFTPFGVGIYKPTPDSFMVSTESVNKNGPSVPATFALYQNYPNPFNPSTVIKFDIPKTGYTDVTVYNTLGQQVKTLVSSVLTPGSYTVQWDARDGVTSGVYLVRMMVSSAARTEFMSVRKIMFIK